MDSHQREVIRQNLHGIDLLLRAIWRIARDQIKAGEFTHRHVSAAQELTEPIYRMLDEDGKESNE